MRGKPVFKDTSVSSYPIKPVTFSCTCDNSNFTNSLHALSFHLLMTNKTTMGMKCLSWVPLLSFLDTMGHNIVRIGKQNGQNK